MSHSMERRISVYRYLGALALVCAMGARLTAQTTRVALTPTAINQTQSIQTGYVVVTPTDGITGGLLVSGNLSLTVGSQMPQGVFTASPLVNAAALPVIDDEALFQNTGIAIVNPNSQAVKIMLVLRAAGLGVP